MKTISKIFKFIVTALVWLIPLSVFVLGLPLGKELDAGRCEVYVVMTLYFLLICSLVGRLLSSKLGSHMIFRIVVPILIIVLPVAAWALKFLSAEMLSAAALAMLAFCFMAWGMVSASAALAAPALLSLIITGSGFLLLERFLDSLPERALHAQVVKIPALAPVDRGNAVYRKDGFRGKRPCIDCKERGLRIFTMGGSSTFGTPMFYAQDSYTARLERLLRDTRPQEKWEVYNAGIPGYGIMQIQDSIEKEISRYKPDIIMICAWFNDSSAIPGWYGFHDKSDKESHELVDLLRRVETSRLYRAFSKSRSYGVFRHYMLAIQEKLASHFKSEKKQRNRPRMTPDEFRWALERILELSKEHSFVPIIVTEAINRTTEFEKAAVNNRYYQVMRDFSDKNQVPLINTLDRLAKARQEWLFYDFIHPNQAGHEIIAETIYDYLLQAQPHPKLKEIYSRLAINPATPRLYRERKFQVALREIPNREIKMTAGIFEQVNEEYVLEMVVNNEVTYFQTGLTSKKTPFTFKFELSSLSRPIVEVAVRAKRLADLEQSSGSSETFPYIEVSDLEFN